MRQGEFEGQFLIFERPRPVPDGWVTRTLGGWTLATCPRLPVQELVDSTGGRVGWVVGYVVTEAGELMADRHVLSAGTSREAYVYSLAGRFIAVVSEPASTRLYLDPSGSLAAVYSADERVAASTTSLLTPVEPGIGALLPNQFYPAGCTAHTGLSRLLPNHYLDLERGRAVRHWLAESVRRISDEEAPAVTAMIAGIVKRNVAAVASRHTTYLGLSAGRDSRAILACSRDLAPTLRYFTFDRGSDGTGVADVRGAQQLATSLGLDHRVIPIVPVGDDVRREYLRRIGHAGHSGKAKDFLHACREHLDLSCAHMIGFVGEVGRGFYWSWRGRTRIPDLLQLMRLDRDHATHGAALADWREGFHPEDDFALLDQLYLEQRLGCWGGPHMYGMAPFSMNISPLNHRRIIEGMLSLPLAYRAALRLPDDMIAFAWPELGQFPYNGLTGLRKHLFAARCRWEPPVWAATRRLRG